MCAPVLPEHEIVLEVDVRTPSNWRQEPQDVTPADDTDSVLGTVWTTLMASAECWTDLISKGSMRSSTTSLREDMIKHREEHGRRYHGYMDAKYVLPMDEEEKDRLDFQTHLAWLSLGKRQTHAPMEKIHRALDVGCGTGLWAIDFADAHPECKVIGVDLAPVQPMFVPPNLQFEVDDLEHPWNFSQKFDYIHSQLMIGAFQDWPKFIGQCFEFSEPGGYTELHDIDFVIKCDDGSLPEDSALRKWHNLMHEGGSAAGFPLDAISKIPEMMKEAGFEDIVAVPLKWPTNPWPKDKHHKEVGLWALENFSWGCESMSLALFTRALGWTADEVTVFMAQVRADLRNRKFHAYWNFWAIYGRKPGDKGSQVDEKEEND
ncbi:hypothetical protein EG329_007684 [Mollisiaceae sp. DMI_Dod_QoI]|nr:hypothetical protein EG329_007684 [Helotiales sp. DMI_Dod_QoI]